ncbi:lipoate--protein ligase family protein [Acidianus sulfidivorans JP7]|uniref:Ligase n=1 Tax=Acidianus sulfidivorans JP7 TaxID=619593 RepID=A0A2U9IPP5_9CREN|nr:lipoate--protein ligase family protein [Acidianus sulfidivorans]AWR97982.1 lipoate--protein ligase family protein [Acidianus sulfidivorans JP7]
MEEFRFIIERGRQETILAGEEALLESVASGNKPILRFVIFDPTAVLLGYHQAAEQEVYIDKVKEKGWLIGRRPTGGGTIIMGPGQLGWEIYSESSLLGGTIESAIQKSADGVIKTLEKLNIKANFRPKNDVEVNGRKISGLGAFSFGKYIAVTGTILLDFNVEDMVSTMKLSSEKMKDKVTKDFKDRLTWVNKELYPSSISMNELIDKAKTSFEESMNVKLQESSYTEDEIKNIKNLEIKYSSYDWIFGLRKPLDGENIKYGEMKFPGGLVKAQVKMAGKDLIESVLITGDFFVEPKRAIYDLEARLKWSKKEEIGKEIEDWYKGVKIIGITKEQLTQFLEGLCQ